jgi:hypothetical protein
MKTGHFTGLTGIALFSGAAAWALHQQFSYIVASWICSDGATVMWTMTGLAVALLSVGGFLSLKALRDSLGFQLDRTRPRHFLATVALLAAVLFLFAIFLQASAVLFLPGCTG